MGVLRALLRNGASFRRNRTSKSGRRDPRRRFVRENRINFEPLEARVVLANTSADGAFSVLLDNAPGDVNGFDGNLALYQSGLVYNSKTVADVVVQFEATLPIQSGTGALPTSVSGTFSFPGQSNQTNYWNVDSNAQGGDKMLFRFPVSISTLASGNYDWDFAATWTFPNLGTDPEPYEGTYFHVDRSASEFGKGWYHQDLHELKLVNPTTNGGQVYLITGGGEPTRFDYNGTVYAREPGDQSFYKLVRSDGADTYYTFTDKWGTKLEFKDTATTNTSAKLEAIFDASGNERRYTYYASNHSEIHWRNKLQTIQYMPTGDTTTFAYSTTNGALTTITETVGSNSRAATFSVSAGQLASITLPDPDGTDPLAAPVWSFAYNGTTGLITKSANPVGSTSVFTYGSGDTVETVVSIKQGPE